MLLCFLQSCKTLNDFTAGASVFHDQNVDLHDIPLDRAESPSDQTRPGYRDESPSADVFHDLIPIPYPVEPLYQIDELKYRVIPCPDSR